MGRGLFIVLEGPDGTGKTTQARRLLEIFPDALLTREPGGTPFAQALRTLALDPDIDRDPTAEMLLFMAARRDHVMRVIKPALERGQTVICDRFSLSTYAYQGQSVFKELIRTCDAIARDRIIPDLTIILDLPTDDCLARIGVRAGRQAHDQFDGRPRAFHEQTRETMLKGPPYAGAWAIVDAAGTAEDVHQRIHAAILAHINKLRSKQSRSTPAKPIPVTLLQETAP